MQRVVHTVFVSDLFRANSVMTENGCESPEKKARKSIENMDNVCVVSFVDSTYVN